MLDFECLGTSVHWLGDEANFHIAEARASQRICRGLHYFVVGRTVTSQRDPGVGRNSSFVQLRADVATVRSQSGSLAYAIRGDFHKDARLRLGA
jgi:hypothetical protein